MITTLFLSLAGCVLLFLCIWGVTVTMPTELLAKNFPEDVQEALKDVEKDIKVAVMGCVVNGPGEAREADIGVAGGVGCGLIFKKGEVLRKVPEEDLLAELLKEIEKL